MEWQQILGFYQIAKLGSFTAAGKATYRTQSALSQQIKALEEEFGCPFFERMGKGSLKLTKAGQIFLRFAESVLSSYDELETELSNFNPHMTGTLKIAAPFTTLQHLLPDSLRTYLEFFPKVDIILLDRPQQEVIHLVRDGEADFGMIAESSLPKDLSAIRWKKVEIVLIVPQGHPLVKEELPSWHDIARYPLIVPPYAGRNSHRAVLDEQFKRPGIVPRVVMESSNVELSAIYVEMGFGIAFATVVKDLPDLKTRGFVSVSLGHYFSPDHIVILAKRNKAKELYKEEFVQTLLNAE